MDTRGTTRKRLAVLHLLGSPLAKRTIFQSKEHWKLECQLLQMKHDKLRDTKPLPGSAEKAPNDDEAKMEEIKEVCVD